MLAALNATEGVVTKRSHPNGEWRALLIEDEAESAAETATRLEESGWGVDVVADGAAGLRQSLAAGEGGITMQAAGELNLGDIP